MGKWKSEELRRASIDSKKPRLPQRGECRVCHCVDDHACEQGCAWADRSHTLCTACAGTQADLHYTLWHIAKTVGKSHPLVRRLAIEARSRHVEHLISEGAE